MICIHYSTRNDKRKNITNDKKVKNNYLFFWQKYHYLFFIFIFGGRFNAL